jgi:hypothetical protein
MISIKKTLLVSSLALVSLPVVSSAKIPGLLQRFQLGYTFVMNTAELKNTTPDTSYSTSFNTSAAFGVTAGTYIPLKRLGRASSLALGIDYMYNMMTWKSKIPGFGGEIDFSGATAQMALPIGLDFKFGADALTVKNHRFCATLGAGAFPSYAVTVLDNSAGLTIDPAFSVAPYVKAEVGIFAGICMKVRAIYTIGNVTYMDYKVTESGANYSTKFSGTSNLAVSLLIMPFSFKWQNEEWWNTY